MIKLSYVTICVDYLDYLSISYRHNRENFDDMIVVTAPHDLATQRFCVESNMGLQVTDAFYQHGAVFNKGAGLNAGLQLAYARAAARGETLDWVAILDADTFVPLNFREHLERLILDPECMYGARRVLLPTRVDYEDWVSGRRPEGSFKSPNGLAFGWLQLINWQSSAIKGRPWGEWYPQSRDCTECDWRFMHFWGDLADEYTRTVGNVRELPFSVYNLGPDGQNHVGRRSPPFV